jgi:hypothetical protein
MVAKVLRKHSLRAHAVVNTYNRDHSSSPGVSNSNSHPSRCGTNCASGISRSWESGIGEPTNEDEGEDGQHGMLGSAHLRVLAREQCKKRTSKRKNRPRFARDMRVKGQSVDTEFVVHKVKDSTIEDGTKTHQSKPASSKSRSRQRFRSCSRSVALGTRPLDRGPLRTTGSSDHMHLMVDAFPSHLRSLANC